MGGGGGGGGGGGLVPRCCLACTMKAFFTAYVGRTKMTSVFVWLLCSWNSLPGMPQSSSGLHHPHVIRCRRCNHLPAQPCRDLGWRSHRTLLPACNTGRVMDGSLRIKPDHGRSASFQHWVLECSSFKLSTLHKCNAMWFVVSPQVVFSSLMIIQQH